MKIKNYLQILSLALPLVISACGGGGGGGSNTQQSTNSDNATNETADDTTNDDNGAPNTPPANTPPVANDDNDIPIIEQGGSITVFPSQGVLANDTDADNDSLIARIVSVPEHGSLTLNLNGSFTYSHDDSNNASDSFTYFADDGTADSNIATVNLSIDLNVPPTAALFCGNTDQAISFVDDLNSVVSDSDGDTLSFTQLTSPANGTVDNFDVTGTFTYTPDSDFRGIDSFTYEVDDLRGGIVTETIQIIVGKTRIMPLGDSITRGVGRRIGNGASAIRTPERPFEVGYREILTNELSDNGFAVDFVGTQSETAVVGFLENQHEGHPSINADEIITGAMRTTTNSVINFIGIANSLALNPTDIVLLHIGTNDIGSNDPIPTIVSDVSGILDAIDNVDPDITVVLARIIFDRDSDPDDGDDPFTENPAGIANVVAVNDAVVAMAQNRINAGDDIIIVDMESNVDPVAMIEDDSSGAHPNALGYEVMADVWLRPLTGTLGIPSGTGVSSNVGKFNGNALLNRCPVI